LGGKSAAIVLDDIDLSTRLPQLFAASLLNAGQMCYASTRILASRSRYTDTVDIVTDLASSLVVGDPLDERTQVGPLVSRAQRERVERLIAAGRAEGARVTTGGSRPAGMDTGWYVEPTVFADLTNEATVAREEIFGPVLTVIGYDDVDDAVRIANDSPYGLGGTVWSEDLERAAAVARRVRAGAVGINQFSLDLAAPFGGMKASGLGRELGPEGLDAYREFQSIYLPA
jgi:acyl-CoA reductase-like NAD-dependent aldehyde dehydrogenase